MDRKLRIFAIVLLIFAFSYAQVDEDSEMEGKVMLWRNRQVSPMRRRFMNGMKRMMTRQMFGCLRVEPPESEMNRGKACMKTALRKTSIYENVKKGIFPDLKKIQMFLRMFSGCRFDAMGVDFNETDFNKEDYRRRLMKFDDFNGDEEDVDVLRDLLETCLQENQTGKTLMEKMYNIGFCWTKNLIDYCEENRRDVGLFLPNLMLLQTIESESKCGVVKVPDLLATMVKECLTKAKNNIGPIPGEIEKTRSPIKRAMLLFKRFMKGIVLEMWTCMDNSVPYNNSTMFGDLDGSVEYVGNFEGFDQIPEQRKMIMDAYLKCGQANGLNESLFIEEKEAKVKKLMQQGSKFSACFLTKFAEICGINNNIAKSFQPMLNKNFVVAAFQTFMEIGGEPAVKTIQYLKSKMNVFG